MTDTNDLTERLREIPAHERLTDEQDATIMEAADALAEKDREIEQCSKRVVRALEVGSKASGERDRLRHALTQIKEYLARPGGWDHRTILGIIDKANETTT